MNIFLKRIIIVKFFIILKNLLTEFTHTLYQMELFLRVIRSKENLIGNLLDKLARENLDKIVQKFRLVKCQ